MPEKNTLETTALRFSMIGYLIMAALGIGFSFLTRSEAILIDGIYSLVSFVMAVLAGRIVRLVERPDARMFHFGFAAFEPLLNALRGLLIFTIVTFAFCSAVSALLSGGRQLNAGLALAYSIVVAALCVAMSIYQRHNAKQVHSPVLEVDAKNWFVDGIITMAVGVAFLGSVILQFTPWAYLLPYVDPSVVVVLTLVLVRMPIVTIRDGLKQLLKVAPDDDVQKDVRARIENALQGVTCRRTEVRMVQIGRFFYVMVQLVVEQDSSQANVKDLDTIRQKIADALMNASTRVVFDVIFTSDEKWIDLVISPESTGKCKQEASPTADTSETRPPDKSPEPPQPKETSQ